MERKARQQKDPFLGTVPLLWRKVSRPKISRWFCCVPIAKKTISFFSTFAGRSLLPLTPSMYESTSCQVGGALKHNDPTQWSFCQTPLWSQWQLTGVSRHSIFSRCINVNLSGGIRTPLLWVRSAEIVLLHTRQAHVMTLVLERAELVLSASRGGGWVAGWQFHHLILALHVARYKSKAAGHQLLPLCAGGWEVDHCCLTLLTSDELSRQNTLPPDNRTSWDLCTLLQVNWARG